MAHQHKGSPVCISPWLSETVSILGAHTQHPASLALISGGAQQAATPAGGAQPQPPVQPGTVPPAAPPPADDADPTDPALAGGPAPGVGDQRVLGGDSGAAAAGDAHAPDAARVEPRRATW